MIYNRVYLGGTFDLFHPGHVALLRWAKETYGIVVVALNRDEFITRYKGKPPVMTFTERWTMLKACRYVDSVIPNYGDEDSKIAIRVVRPDVIVVGSDWEYDKILKQMDLTVDFLNEHHIAMVIYPRSLPLHTSDIKKRILA